MKKYLITVICSLLFFSISSEAADFGELVNTMKSIAEQANKSKNTNGSDAIQQQQPVKQIDQTQQNLQLEQANQETALSKQEADRAKEEAVMAKQEAMLAKQEAEQAKQEAAMARQETDKLKAEGVTNPNGVEVTSSTPEDTPTVTPQEAEPEALPTLAVNESTVTKPNPQPIVNPTTDTAIGQASNLKDITFSQWILYIYMLIATYIGTLFVRPPLMKWWNSQLFFVSGDNVVHVFFKRFGMRLTWEAFVLAMSAAYSAEREQ